MNTILFSWNPAKWKWDNIEEAVVEANLNGTFCDEWSCGNSKFIGKGDRAFLVKLGAAPKGIIGSGYVISDMFLAPHWDTEKVSEKPFVGKVLIEFDVLSKTPILEEEELEEHLPGQVWLPQSSGIRVIPEVAEMLEAMWREKTGGSKIEEVKKKASLYSEGNRVVQQSTYYEREPKARLDCLAHHGYSCQICGINFLEFYSELGRDFIHVHHKTPLSEIGSEYEVDPINDLVPICPNCHAMIHKKVPALRVEDLHKILNEALRCKGH